MLGLLFVVMLAAVMSTIGSNLNFGAQVLVSDVYRRYLRPAETDQHYMWIARLATVLILSLALLVAYKIDLIFRVAVFMLGFSAAELPANWAQWWWWRFNRWGRLAASFGAPVILVAVTFLLPHWPWWNQTYLVVALNTILWITVTLVTPPDSPEVLTRFYGRARPLGHWGPVRRLESSCDSGEHTGTGGKMILAGLLLAIIGATSVALLVLGLSHLYAGSYTRGVLELTGFALGGGVFFAAYGAHLDRLERWAKAQKPDAEYTFAPAFPVVADDESAPHPAAAPARPVSSAQPAPTSVVVAVSTSAFGVVIAAVGVLGTSGRDMVLSLITGAAFAVSAFIVWRFGTAAARAPSSFAPEVFVDRPAGGSSRQA
jgi:hypothetical protein